MALGKEPSRLPVKEEPNFISLNHVSDPSSSISLPSVSTPVMGNNPQFQNLVTPQLPPPPLITPTHPVKQASNLEGRRLTLITGQELNDVRKNLATDQKTPAEYTLHILFTQFVRHAERKLNLCLNNYSLETEPPIVELLSEGADPEFDKIIESLGRIARRKPKSVIDSVMFWRKSKSEVSMLAATGVEKSLKNLRAEQKKLNGSNSSLSSSDSKSLHLQLPPQLQRPAQIQQKGLYRQTSLSFIRGHRKSNSRTTLTTKSSSSTDPQASAVTQQNLQTNATIRALEIKLEEARITAIQGERKSLISIYILCRVLIAVVRQIPPDVLGEDLGDKLEDIIYTQLKTTDPLLISGSVIRSSNWNLFAELLGHMSEKRFLNVSDRFIADLEKVPPVVINGRVNYTLTEPRVPIEDLFNETGDNEYIEESLALLIHGMRYLKLKHYPLEDFEECADFLQSIGKFFSNSETESMIVLFSEVLNLLLLPLAGVITAEVNHPQWREAIDLIYQKLLRILKQEPDKYWECALNLITTVLTVSPTEIFLKNWMNVIEANAVVLKPKISVDDKIIYVTCFSRLLWVYLYRCTESLNSTHRTLDSLFQLLFFKQTGAASKKQQWLTSDFDLIELLVCLIRIVGYSSLNYTLEKILLPLIKMGYNGGPGLENISHPFLILAIRCYVCILNDFEMKKRPSFPSDELVENVNNDLYIQNTSKLSVFNTQQPVFQKDTSNALISEEISNVFQQVFFLLDQFVGAPTWQSTEDQVSHSSNNSAGSAGSSPLSPFASKSPFYSLLHGKDHQTQLSKSQNLELFSTFLEAAPFMSDNMGSKKLIEILVRNSIHHDVTISKNAIDSLKVLMVKKNPKLLITVFARYAFQLDDNPKHSFSLAFLTSAEYLKLLKIYVELLVCWLNSLRMRVESLETQQDDVVVPINGHPLLLSVTTSSSSKNDFQKVSDELELKNISTIIEEVEGNGLFFLCSQDSNIRGLGLQILKIISRFDDVINDISTIYKTTATSVTATPRSRAGSIKKHTRTPSKFAAEFGTRLIQVLDLIDFFELIAPLENEISYPEKSRLRELRQRRRKNLLTYLAKSDYGIDSTLWFKIFPKILKIIFDKCAMTVALCRSIVCVRLVQMYDSIFEFANASPAQQKMPQMPTHQSSNSTSSFFSGFNSASNQGDAQKTFGSQSKLVHKHFSPPELLVEQWRIYLIFACSTLTATYDQRMHIPSSSTSTAGSSGFSRSHSRKKSQQIFTVQHQKITSAKSIFKMVIPLLGTQQSIVRDAIVACLSSINVNIFKSFIESVIPIAESWMDESRLRDQWSDKVKIEIARVLNNVTFGFLHNSSAYSDDWVLANLVTIVKYLKTFLSYPSVQVNIEFQRLRRYFAGILENVFTGIMKTDNPEKWFPFEARISCFKFLEEWCGYGKYASITESRYKDIIAKRSGSSSRDSMSVSAAVELERSALELASISCMATLCSAPITKVVEENDQSVTMSFDIPGLLLWIHSLFSSSDERIYLTARRALSNILIVNTSNKDIFLDIINQCYISYDNDKSSECYFLTLTDSLMKIKSLPVEPYRILSLCFFAVSNDNHKIRVAAAKTLTFVEKLVYDTSNVEPLTERICSKSKPVYKSGLFHVAAIFSKDVQIISELTHVFHIVGPEYRRDILSALLPFANSMELQVEDPVTDEASQMVLHNLLEITVKYSDIMPNEIEGLWVALGNGNNAQNVRHILAFIISNSLQRGNPYFVQYSRQIIVYLSNTPAGGMLVGEFISNLAPKNMVPRQLTEPVMEPQINNMPYISDIWETLSYSGKEAIFSLGQLSVIFLSDLLISPPEALQTNLPLLLHVSFVLLDHYLPLVQDVALEMLMHLVHGLAGDDPKALEIVALLRKRDPKSFWVYDDLNSDKNGARTPATMDVLIRSVLKVLGVKFPSLQEEWSRVSLSWATTCAVRHIACRSFQVFRSLLSFLDQGMLRDMLHRLSNTISDETPDIQGFAMQILMTLNAITAELDALQLIDFPQLFWSSVACLSSVHEQEYVEVLSTLSKFVSKIDLDSELTVSCLTSTFPPKWEGKFDGLQQIVMIGLRSSDSWEHSLRLLDRLNKLHDSQIIGSGDSRILLAVLCNLPRYLHAFTTNNYTEDVIDSAETICLMVDRIDLAAEPERDRSPLKRILQSFVKKRFRTKQDFLNEVTNKIVTYFFPTFQAQTLVFLLGILSNSIGWVKIETMEVLEKIVPKVDLQSEEFIGVGADLISPLLRLLLTDYAEQALKVLDEAVSISGSQLDKDVLRMSLGNKSIRKEYEKTATLFGIPDETGWAIPMPAVTLATTRNNVHAVFSTCVPANSNTEAEQQTNTANVEFHREEYIYEGSNGEMGEALSTVASYQQPPIVEQQQDPSLSHIYAALVNLDSFFADDTDTRAFPSSRPGISHQYNSSLDTKESNIEPVIPFESAPQVYDKKVSAILNRSLARTPSNTSFKTSLADSFGSSPSGLTDQYITRDSSNYSISQRGSAMSFRSNRTSARRLALDTALVTSSVTDLTKAEERSPHRTPPLMSPSVRDLNSPFLGSDQQEPIHTQAIQTQPFSFNQQQNHESSFKFEGILRSSNKARRKSGKVNGNGNINNSNSNNTTNNNNSINTNSVHSGHKGSHISVPGSSNGSPNDFIISHNISDSSNSQTPTIANAGVTKSKDRSSVFSRAAKKNPPKSLQNRN